MSEATALSLATSLPQLLQAANVHFLLDNQLLVNFIGPDSSNPRIGESHYIHLLPPVW
jgi:hypothetical protein